MVIYLIAVGQNMPAWVKTGYDEYASRLKQEVELKLIEVAPSPRKKKSDPKKILKEEADRIRKAIPKNAYIVGLDVIGKAISTPELSQRLENWMQMGRDVAILIGGPEGFDPEIKKEFETSISLSKLTLPHPMVRVIIAEQLFRAWSIIHNHPYHRE